MVYIFIFILFLFILTKLFNYFGINSFLINIISFALIFIFSGFVTYTLDWDSYEYFMYEGMDSSDYFFVLIYNLVLKSGYDFALVHKMHIIISAIFLLFFISRFYRNAFIIILLYLPIIYLFYTTQIRFFAGYYAALVALYFLLVKDNKVLFFVFFIFAFLNHTTLILLSGIVILYKMNTLKYTRYIYWLSVFFFITIMVMSYFKIDFFNTGKISAYTQKEISSSIGGGIFTFFPYIVISVLTYFYYKLKAGTYELLNDRKAIFLFKMSIYPMIFIVAAFYFQVIGHRFIFPSILMNILLFYYIESKSKSQIKIYVIFYSILILLFFYNYFLPEYILNSDNTEAIRLMLHSNPIIEYLYE